MQGWRNKARKDQEDIARQLHIRKGHTMKLTAKIVERSDGRLVYEVRRTCESRPTRSRYWATIDEESWNAEQIRYEDIPLRDGWNPVNVGDIVMVGKLSHTAKGIVRLITSVDNGEGWPGNSDPNIRQYHGWRGTNDDWAFFGLGLRKVESIAITGGRSKKLRIVFSKDLTEGNKE